MVTDHMPKPLTIANMATSTWHIIAGIFGIPKEPAGVSNWNGKGTPGSWDKQKINVNESHGSVQINLYQL